MGRLEDLGHEIRRPEADLLRDGIYELRIGLQGINYRVLYFFHGKEAAVVSHGLTKERRVPPARSTRQLSERRSSKPTLSSTRFDRSSSDRSNCTMGRKSRFASKALEFAYDRYVGNDKAKAEAFEAELANADVARKLYDLRTKAGLTQSGLAKLVGTSTSVISRLEDAEYEGHSLAMLRRVASALNKRVEIRFVSVKAAASSAS